MTYQKEVAITFRHFVKWAKLTIRFQNLTFFSKSIDCTSPYRYYESTYVQVFNALSMKSKWQWKHTKLTSPCRTISRESIYVQTNSTSKCVQVELISTSHSSGNQVDGLPLAAIPAPIHDIDVQKHNSVQLFNMILRVNH